jgi:CheY-like chemotaxis protein
MHDEIHILLIDDDAAMIQMVEDILAMTSCHLHSFMDYRDGLRRAMTNPPDLILLDVHMPEVNGLALLEQFRKMKSTRSTPVVMVTGDSHLETVQKAKEIGISAYVLKPFKPVAFIQTLEKVLQRPLLSPLQQTRLTPKAVGKVYTPQIKGPKAQRLMVLDDEPMMHQLIQDILSDSRVEVSSYKDPHQALRDIMLSPPDVLLSDVNMPEFNGVQLTLQLKKMRSTHHLPIVLMSGEPMNRLPVEIQDLNVEGFLAKPFTPKQLVAVLQPLFKESIF